MVQSTTYAHRFQIIPTSTPLKCFHIPDAQPDRPTDVLTLLFTNLERLIPGLGHVGACLREGEHVLLSLHDCRRAWFRVERGRALRDNREQQAPGRVHRLCRVRREDGLYPP